MGVGLIDIKGVADKEAADNKEAVGKEGLSVPFWLDRACLSLSLFLPVVDSGGSPFFLFFFLSFFWYGKQRIT